MPLCRSCALEKDPDDFYTDRTRSGGVRMRRQCKACFKNMMREIRQPVRVRRVRTPPAISLLGLFIEGRI